MPQEQPPRRVRRGDRGSGRRRGAPFGAARGGGARLRVGDGRPGRRPLVRGGAARGDHQRDGVGLRRGLGARARPEEGQEREREAERASEPMPASLHASRSVTRRGGSSTALSAGTESKATACRIGAAMAVNRRREVCRSPAAPRTPARGAAPRRAGRRGAARRCPETSARHLGCAGFQRRIETGARDEEGAADRRARRPPPRAWGEGREAVDLGVVAQVLARDGRAGLALVEGEAVEQLLDERPRDETGRERRRQPEHHPPRRAELAGRGKRPATPTTPTEAARSRRARRSGTALRAARRRRAAASVP